MTAVISCPIFLFSRAFLVDPLESKYVSLSSSTREGAGEGIFAKRDVAAGDIIAVMGGVIAKDGKNEIKGHSTYK